MIRPPILLCLASLAIVPSIAPPASAAETNAVIPYKTLDEMFQPIAKIDQSRLQIRAFVSSTNRAVHPSDITLTIHSVKKGFMPLMLGTNGQILEFPHDNELLRENPDVIANQPKGALQLWVFMQIPPPAGLAFRYSRLGDGVAEMNKAIHEQAGMVLSVVAPKIKGVIFFFPMASAGKATVEIKSAAGVKQYTTDKAGRVKLKLEKALLTENPEIKVSEKPASIVPDMEGL